MRILTLIILVNCDVPIYSNIYALSDLCKLNLDDVTKATDGQELEERRADD